MTSYPKQPPGRSEEYLEYIRGLPCCICQDPAEPHHLLSAGVGQKGSDFSCVPLCRVDHMAAHNVVEAEYNISLWYEALKALTAWADRHWSDNARCLDKLSEGGDAF